MVRRVTPLAALVLVVGCQTEAPQETSIGFGSEETSGDRPAQASTSGAAATTANTGSTTDVPAGGTASSAGSDEAPTVFDLGSIPDAPPAPEPQPLPTCDNINELDETSVGCEFWAVDLPFPDLGYPLGIAVGNPSRTTAHVVIEDLAGEGGTVREIVSFSVDPEQSRLEPIPMTQGGGWTLANLGLKPRTGYRIRSDVPITAMQINPAGGQGSYTSDASMLLPVNSLGKSHYAIGYLGRVGDPAEASPGWIVVVATEDATTLFTEQGDYLVDAFDSFVFQTESEDDPSGFFVGSDRPVAVFSGNNCTNIPGNAQYCDHLEEQVLPLSTWGTHYVGARHPKRLRDEPEALPETVYWRIYAANNQTTVAITPPLPGVGDEVFLLRGGDHFQFAATQSFVAHGDQPFMLVQYMSSCQAVLPPSQCYDDRRSGDPYMAQVVPTDQWLTAAPFLTDNTYQRDFVVVTRRVGTQVELRCLGVLEDERFTAVPGSNYEVGFVDLDLFGTGGEGSCRDGAQFVTADNPVGLLVGGLDYANSYGYPGGMGLRPLWTPPQKPAG